VEAIRDEPAVHDNASSIHTAAYIQPIRRHAKHTNTRIRKPREAKTAPRAGTPPCAGSSDLQELQIPGHHARDWWMRFQVLGRLGLDFVFECLEGEGWLGRRLVI
jgi:hypothetical protein